MRPGPARSARVRKLQDGLDLDSQNAKGHGESRTGTADRRVEVDETYLGGLGYYETEAGFPPAPAVIIRAKALQISTDELLGQW